MWNLLIEAHWCYSVGESSVGGIIKKKHRMKANYLLFGREREKAYRSKDLSPQENSITSSWRGQGGERA